jgi:uncharacterized membrane protein
MSKKQKHRVPVKKQGTKQQSQQIIHQEQHISTGPLPQPDIMRGYESIVPGAAERILAMAEQESEHLRQHDVATLNAYKSDVRRSQILAFLSISLFVSLAGIAIVYNQPWIAGIVGGTTIISVVSAFLKTQK